MEELKLDEAIAAALAVGKEAKEADLGVLCPPPPPLQSPSPANKRKNTCDVCGQKLGRIGAGSSTLHMSVLRLMNECPRCKSVVCRSCKHTNKHQCECETKT